MLSAAGAVLAAAAEADSLDEAGPDEAGLAVRDVLRRVLLRHLDEDLATEDVLLAAFRGKLPDG